MDWLKNRKVQQFAAVGFLGGLLLLIAGLWLTFERSQLPLAWWAFPYIHRTQPMLFILDLAPIILAGMAGLLGLQSSLSATIARGKKEWEAIFDSFSDLIFVTDTKGLIVRCNHAAINRLNSTFIFLIGRPLTEVLTMAGGENLMQSQTTEDGFSWLGRLYDVSTYPIQVKGAERQNLFILHDITQRVEMQNNLSMERNLLRTLIDNLPDRIYVKDNQGRKTISNMADWRASGGKQMEDVIGKSDFDLYPAELANKYWADDKTIFDSAISVIDREEPGLDSQGQAVWVVTTKVPLQDEDGRVVGLVGVGRDSTRQKKSEEKLRQLSQAVEQSASTIVITGLDGGIVYANPKFTETTGYTLDEVLGANPRILKSGHTMPEEYKKLWDTITSGREWYGEFQNRKKNGELYWESATISPILNEAKEITHFLAVKEDVTERKQAEAAVEQSETLFRGLFDLSPDAIVVIDPHAPDTSWPIIDCNMVACVMSGYQREELIGQSIDILNLTTGTPDERVAYLDQLRAAGHLKLETEHRRKNGEIFPVEVSTTIIKIGERELIIGIDRDITERKRVDAELHHEKQFQEALISNSPTAIVVLDNKGNIVSCNPAFEQLYGYTALEAVGENLDSLITTPETIDQAGIYTQQALTGSVHGFGSRRRKDGSFASVEILGVPIIVGEEKVGSLAIYHDITELDRARKEAEEASRAKSEFLANMSHEIRTPMNGVMGMLELTLETQLTTEQRDFLETSLHSAEALLSILNDILDFSKIEAGKLDLERINFSLRNTVEDVAFTLAARAQDKGLEIACLIHPDITSNLRGDPGRLRQILVNLVGNAIKFTHQGEIVIQAESIQETDSDAVVRFSVQDTGVGISPERQAAVFDRFTQADGSTTRKFGGTGLGLTISKQLVEAMGGRIGVDSTPGVGSTFWFDVKFEKQPPAKRGGTAPLSLAGPVNLGAARILVIDDNQTNRLILTKNVEAMGCRIEAVSSGAKGLEGLRNAHRAGDPYHVVLLDMQMPGMDGEQTARAIKSDPAVKDVKILILTSMGHRGDAARLEALGCSGYLLKPVKQQMLFDAVIAVLGREKQESPGLITRHILSEHRKLNLRLLLAEDNPINQKVAVTVLQKAGYSVDAVDNGLDVLPKVMANQYNAILMDVQMPVMDGFEATHQVRAWEQERGTHIPIIAMTAHAMQGDRERCLEAGMDDYVTKPLQPKVLFSALDRWIQMDAPLVEPVEAMQDYSSAAEFDSVDMDDGLFGESAPAAAGGTKEDVLVFQTVSFADVPPADFESALTHFDGDRNFMMEMFQEYKAQLGKRVDEIHSALEDHDANRLARLAHNLKGVSLNFSAEPLATIALQLEEMCKREDLTHAPSLVAQLDVEARRLEEFLSK